MCYLICNRITTSSLTVYYSLFITSIIFLNSGIFHGYSISQLIYSILGVPSLLSFIYSVLLCLHQVGLVKNLISNKGKKYILIITLLFYASYFNVLPINVFYLNEQGINATLLFILLGAFFIQKQLGYMYCAIIIVDTLFLPQSYNVFYCLFDPLIIFLLALNPKQKIGLDTYLINCRAVPLPE